MELEKLKSKAGEAFAKGKFGRAAELYREYCQGEPRDLQARIRMGDAWARTGERAKAIAAYQAAAEGFAKDGFFPRAIAAGKLVLELDPAHTGVQRMLADLYAKKGGASRESSAPLEITASSGANAPGAASGRTQAAGGSARGTSLSSRGRGALELPQVEGDELPLLRNTMAFEPETAASPTSGKRSAGASGVTSEGPQPGPPQEEKATRRSAASPPAEAAARASATPAPTPVVGATRGERPSPAVATAPAEPPSPAAAHPVVAAKSPPSGPQRGELAGTPPPSSPVASSASSSALADSAEPAGDDVDLVDISAPAEAFTELELDGDSLLHAVERAARIGAKAPAGSARVPPLEAAAAPERPNKLPEVPLFSDLPPEAFIELFERGPMLRFKKGQRIFEQGSVGRSFYIVCRGSVRVIRQNGSARELAQLPEGSFFGEMALLSDNPRIASVEAASDEAEVLEISAALLSELSSRHPPVANALRKFCRQRLLLNVMNTSALFQPFDGKDRRALIERFRAREVATSTAIVREGEHSDGLYVILSGEVQVSREGRVLAQLREGDIFGEMSLLEKAPATATVSAVRRTSLLRLPREDFDELIMSHPQVLVLVSQLTEDRRRQTDAILAGAAAVGAEGLILI